MIQNKKRKDGDESEVAERVLMHVGYPKTASTMLQMHYFPALPRVQYLGKFIDKKSRYPHGVSEMQRLINGDPVRRKHWTPERYKCGLETTSVGPNLLLSEEKIVASYMIPRRRHWFLWRPVDIHKSVRVVYDALKLIAHHPKIIITIREQSQLIPSLYAQAHAQVYSKRSWGATLENYVEMVCSNEANFLSEAFDFNLVVDAYKMVFGKGSVHVIPYEKMCSEPSTLPQAIEDLLVFERGSLPIPKFDKRENVRFHEGWYLLNTRHSRLGLLRGYLGNSRERIVRGIRKRDVVGTSNDVERSHKVNNTIKVKLSDDAVGLIKRHFSGSNKMLAEKNELDLQKYNYY